MKLYMMHGDNLKWCGVLTKIVYDAKNENITLS